MAWAKHGTETLAGTADSVTSTGTATKFNVVMSHLFPSGADTFRYLRFNSDGGSLYARRFSINGGSDGTGESVVLVNTGIADGDNFNLSYHGNISGEEKLGILWVINSTDLGASNAPQRGEFVLKYVPSPLTDTLDSIEYYNDNAGVDYEANSNISVLGTD